MRMCEHSKSGVQLLCQIAKDGHAVAEAARTLRNYYQEVGVWDYRQWVGGYELGIAFPPDWVGEWLFNVEGEADQGVFEAGMVTNFESVFASLNPLSPGIGVNIDTIVYGQGGAQALSQVDMMPIVVG